MHRIVISILQTKIEFSLNDEQKYNLIKDILINIKRGKGI